MKDSQTEPRHLSLPATAMRLGCSWGVAWRKLLTGELEGKMVGGRWFVSEESIRRVEQSVSDHEPVPAA
jgi:hypothetical protein